MHRKNWEETSMIEKGEEKEKEKKEAGVAVYEHKPDELKNVARLTVGQQALKRRNKINFCIREPSSDYHSFHLRNEAIIKFRTNFTAAKNWDWGMRF